MPPRLPARPPLPPRPEDPARQGAPTRSRLPVRLRDGRAFTSLGLAAGIAVPGALLGGPPTSAAEHSATATVLADQQPACGAPDARDFPIDTRIHGGPDTYASGGGYGTWYLDLVNTTSESCRALHPVLVLTDQDRQLTPDQIQLAYTEGAGTDAGAATEHRVSWETTDRNEQIGVFGGGEGGDDFAGFTVPAGRTVTVRVRMAFTSDTRPGKVVANAAVVQRHRAGPAGGRTGGDGDWVGESEDYPFSIVEGDIEGDIEGGTDLVLPSDASPSDASTLDASDPGETAHSGETADLGETAASGAADEGAGSRTGTDPTPARSAHPEAGTGGDRTPGSGTGSGTGTGATGTGPAPDSSVGPGAPTTPRAPSSPPGSLGLPRDPAGNPLPELARTGRPGPAAALRTGAVAVALLLGGTAALLLARRMRRGRSLGGVRRTT